MNFFPPPPTIKAELYVRIPDELRCTGRETEWRGGFARRFQDIFLEGPVADDLGNLYIVDVPYGRILKIRPDKSVSVAAEWDGEPNGLAATSDGDLVIADYKQGILQFDPSTRKVKPRMTRRHLERFKGPNDLIVDSKGNLYFTDQGQTSITDPTGKVYRLSPDGKLDTLVENGVSPNGLVLSLNERFLFVAMTRANQVWRLPLHEDGTTTKGGVFFQSFGAAGPDGLALDEEGSLFICHPSLGVWNGRRESHKLLLWWRRWKEAVHHGQPGRECTDCAVALSWRNRKPKGEKHVDIYQENALRSHKARPRQAPRHLSPLCATCPLTTTDQPHTIAWPNVTPCALVEYLIPMSMAEEASQLPSCQRCKLRKIRCDHAPPKCAACTKASSACIIVDPITQKQYTREYIHDLERKESQLSEKLKSRRVPQRTSTASGSHEIEHTTPRDAPSAESTTTFGGYVGENSGLNLLQSVFADTEWRTQRLRETGQRPQMPELAMSAHVLPPSNEAAALLENYFSRFHINHTFLVREDVLEVYTKVYGSKGNDQCSSQDQFRLFMIFAISGVTRYRAGLSKEHPFGYYLAALAHVKSVPLIGSPDAIQNSLLMARFGMYQHIGTSLWDISQFVMRQCIELGYHAAPCLAVPAIEEQKQRRIFWECYILDRYSSGILGRPFAIADDDISVDLPILADDDALKVANVTSLSALSNVAPSQPTEVSVFVFYIRLRQVSSRIHAEFYNGRKQSSRSANSTPMPFTSAGYVQMKVHDFFTELELWRQSAPVFTAPQSLYERPEWYDFLLEKEKLILLRGAIHTAPKLSNNSPPLDLLMLSLRAATKAIKLYSDMLEMSYITWTRSYFQNIFTAGLSILFCLNLNPEIGKDTSADIEVPPSTALQLCSHVLHSFEKEMPDVRTFAVVFDELKELVARKIQKPLDKAIGHMSIPANGSSKDLNGNQSVNDSGIDQNNHQSFNEATDFSMSAMDLSNSNLDVLSTDQYGLDWSIMTEEFMENLEAGLGEYAWGFAGDDLYYWNQPDLT
ncbi:hypothetical protein Q7P37_008651 [Cladosporium fusiforme]